MHLTFSSPSNIPPAVGPVNSFRYAAMHPLTRIFRAFGILLGVLALFIFLDYFSYRYSLFFWMCASAVLLPTLYLVRWNFKSFAVSFCILGFALALSPADIAFVRGHAGLRILPTSHGVAAKPGTMGYGCTVRNPPKIALAISF